MLTDSGGIQEEAALGIPVLMLRETTERIEGVHAGVAKLVGVVRTEIVRQTMDLLTDREALTKMARATNPYGDGHAAERIAAIILREPWSAIASGDSRPAPGAVDSASAVWA